MNLYIATLEVAGGILTPIVIILLILLTIEVVKTRRQRIEYKREKLEKYHVFDNEAEFYEVLNPTMVGVRLKKGDKVVWEGGIDREGIV